MFMVFSLDLLVLFVQYELAAASFNLIGVLFQNEYFGEVNWSCPDRNPSFPYPLAFISG